VCDRRRPGRRRPVGRRHAGGRGAVAQRGYPGCRSGPCIHREHTALCAHTMVDAGCSRSRRRTRAYWPEYGRNGNGSRTTGRHAASPPGSLPAVRSPLPRGAFYDWRAHCRHARARGAFTGSRAPATAKSRRKITLRLPGRSELIRRHLRDGRVARSVLPRRGRTQAAARDSSSGSVHPRGRGVRASAADHPAGACHPTGARIHSVLPRHRARRSHLPRGSRAHTGSSIRAATPIPARATRRAAHEARRSADRGAITHMRAGCASCTAPLAARRGDGELVRPEHHARAWPAVCSAGRDAVALGSRPPLRASALQSSRLDNRGSRPACATASLLAGGGLRSLRVRRLDRLRRSAGRIPPCGNVMNRMGPGDRCLNEARAESRSTPSTRTLG
jgi:hypothetical protein